MSFPFQTTYPYNMPIGVAGRIADNCFKNTLSPIAGQDLYAARGVMKALNSDYVVTLPGYNTNAMNFSTALVTGNVINGTVDGIAITPVTYATSNAATLAALATQLQALASIETAVSNGTNAITITYATGRTPVFGPFVVTGGAGQAVITFAQSQTATFFGVTQAVYNKQNSFNAGNDPLLAGQLPYFTGDPVPTLTQGRIYVVPETVITANSPVYIRFAPNGANTTLGLFRGDADSGTCLLIDVTDAKWREGNGAVGDLAVLELTIS